MGRKIPAKKHRGVKDPLEQQARRLQSLKTKINAPPKDPDEQPVPKSLVRLFAFQNPQDKHNNKKKVKRLHTKDIKGSTVQHNPVSKLRKLPGESGRGFSLRINSAVRALHGDLTTQDYPQDLEEEGDSRGSRMEELRSRRARRRRRAAGGREPAPAGDGDGHKLTRTRKLALRKQAKKERAEEAARDSSALQYERVAFGDVTHAPPALPARPAAPRPGRRDLLLCKLLAGEGGGARAGAGAGGAPPPAEVARRERARLAAVQAYRDLKRANKPANKLP